jgi:hypothetical protein
VGEEWTTQRRDESKTQLWDIPHLQPNPRHLMARQGEWSCTFNLSASSACCLIHSMKRLGSARYCFLSDATCFLSFIRAASDQGSLPHTRSQNTNINEKRSSLGHWSSPVHAWEDYTVSCSASYRGESACTSLRS